MSTCQTRKRRLGDSATLVDFVRIALITRGWTVADLARRIGWKRSALSVALSLGVPGRRLRAAIEAAFGYELRLWDDQNTLALRKRCVESLGFDPRLVSLPVLRQHAYRFGIRDSRAHRSQPLLLEKFFEFLAANPNLNPASYV
jgi:hypothetical protein